MDLNKATSDKEELDHELEQLKIRHSTISQHFEEKEKSWKDQLEQATSDASLAAGEQAEAVRHLMRRNEVMAAAFKVCMLTLFRLLYVVKVNTVICIINGKLLI